jgi:hypothetical protein
MTIAALAPSGVESPDGLAYDLKSKVDELIAAANAAGLFQQQADPGDIKPTVNTSAPTAHTAATAIAATYADLPAARTSVNALRTDVEAALTVHDGDLTTLRTEVEARLDAIETKLDAVIGVLLAAGVTA